MAIATNAIKKLFSLAHIFNSSFDDSYQVLAVENLVLDTVSGDVKRLTSADLGVYKLNNVETASSTVTYLGTESPDGNYLIKKIDTSSGVAITYATIANNASVSTYSSAWSQRATLTYNVYSVAV